MEHQMPTTTYNFATIDRILSTLINCDELTRRRQEYFVNSELKELSECLTELLNGDTDFDVKTVITQLRADYPSVNINNLVHFKKVLQPWLTSSSNDIIAMWKKSVPSMIDEAIRTVSDYDLDGEVNPDGLSQFRQLSDRAIECLNSGKTVEVSKPCSINHLYVLDCVVSNIDYVLHRSHIFNDYLDLEIISRDRLSSDKKQKVQLSTIIGLLIEEDIDPILKNNPLTCEKSRNILAQYKIDLLDYLTHLKEVMTPLFS